MLNVSSCAMLSKTIPVLVVKDQRPATLVELCNRSVMEIPVNMRAKYYCNACAIELAVWFQIQLENHLLFLRMMSQGVSTGSLDAALALVM